jgi:hypothetical protein
VNVKRFAARRITRKTTPLERKALEIKASLNAFASQKICLLQFAKALRCWAARYAQAKLFFE